MKNITSTIAVAFLGMALATPGASQEIVVAPKQTAVELFVDEVSLELSENLERIRLNPISLRGGTAQVRFKTDADGEVSKAWFYKKSRDRQVNLAAMRAVKRLDPLDFESIGYPQDTIVQANIIVANSREQFERLAATMERQEATRIASAGPKERKVLALNLVR